MSLKSLLVLTLSFGIGILIKPTAGFSQYTENHEISTSCYCSGSRGYTYLFLRSRENGKTASLGTLGKFNNHDGSCQRAMAQNPICQVNYASSLNYCNCVEKSGYTWLYQYERENGQSRYLGNLGSFSNHDGSCHRAMLRSGDQCSYSRQRRRRPTPRPVPRPRPQPPHHTDEISTSCSCSGRNGYTYLFLKASENNQTSILGTLGRFYNHDGSCQRALSSNSVCRIRNARTLNYCTCTEKSGYTWLYQYERENGQSRFLGNLGSFSNHDGSCQRAMLRNRYQCGQVRSRNHVNRAYGRGRYYNNSSIY